MKKSTLLLAAWVLLSGGVLRAQEITADENPSVGAQPTPPPLLIALALPGMRVLPQPLITDLTNFPNPFDSRKAGLEGQTQISYSLAKDARVEMELYDLLGHKVRSWDIAAGSAGGRAGSNLVAWDGTDGQGRKVSKGGYIAQIVIETPETTVTVVRKIGVIH